MSAMASLGRILMVEDHGDSAEVLSLLLARKGYSVNVALNATDARAAARVEKFDLLICDMLLPDGDGWELCREIGQATGLKSIALTAQGYPADLARSKEAGCLYHLTKPVSFDVLLSTIKQVLEHPGAIASPAAVGNIGASLGAPAGN